MFFDINRSDIESASQQKLSEESNTTIVFPKIPFPPPFGHTVHEQPNIKIDDDKIMWRWTTVGLPGGYKPPFGQQRFSKDNDTKIEENKMSSDSEPQPIQLTLNGKLYNTVAWIFPTEDFELGINLLYCPDPNHTQLSLGWNKTTSKCKPPSNQVCPETEDYITKHKDAALHQKVIPTAMTPK